MYTLRRWWERYGSQLVLVGLALGIAWSIRQTDGAIVFETYRKLARPFQGEPTRQEQLIDARVLELQQRIVELKSQNQKLQNLLGQVSPEDRAQGTVAPIVGRSADQWWQQVTLGRGSSDGLETDNIVTGPGGLVGRITSVTETTSRVLLISDPTSRVGITVSRSRFMGFMRGQGSELAVMEFFDKVPDVRPGDAIATSSFSRLFPPGVPVGKVKSVDLNKSPAPEAIIELSAPISALEWVMVYPSDKVPNLLPSKSKSKPDNGSKQKQKT